MPLKPMQKTPGADRIRMSVIAVLLLSSGRDVGRKTTTPARRPATRPRRAALTEDGLFDGRGPRLEILAGLFPCQAGGRGSLRPGRAL